MVIKFNPTVTEKRKNELKIELDRLVNKLMETASNSPVIESYIVMKFCNNNWNEVEKIEFI